MVALVESGQGDFQGCHSQLLRTSLDNGYIALILGESDETSLAEFRKAVGYAVTLLTGSGTAHGFRSFEVEASVSEKEMEVTAIHEKPQGAPGKARPLDPTYYKMALSAVVAFGGENERRVVASYPEERYRNPNVIVGESLFTELRAMKAGLRGEEGLAKNEAQAALSACREATQRPEIAALVSLLTGDEARFHEQLEERVKAYKKQYQRSPNVPEGFVYLFGLALCRLALERGIKVEESPYLPVRLLPNYKPAVH